jgi:hypothetical protein
MKDADEAVEGWMHRCVLIASPRQAQEWRTPLLDAARKAHRELVFLDAPVDRPEKGRGSNVIFVSADRRHFAPAEDCKRAVLFHGIDNFAGLDDIDPQNARIHIIEMSRYAIEALDWSGAASAGDDDAVVHLFDEIEVVAPALTPSGAGEWDRIASHCLRFPAREGTTDWSPELFLITGRKEPSVDERDWRDLTGPPRTLLRGPYLWTRPGRWRVRAQFAVDEDGSKQELDFRWGPVLSTNRLTATPGAPGFFEVDLDAEWESIDGMEFSIALNHSAISGRISFIGASVTPS